MTDDLHPITVRVTELTYQILQAHAEVDEVQGSTRLAGHAEDLADKIRLASNSIQRAIERQQLAETASNRVAR